jgi:hypothetical protein
MILKKCAADSSLMSTRGSLHGGVQFLFDAFEVGAHIDTRDSARLCSALRW